MKFFRKAAFAGVFTLFPYIAMAEGLSLIIQNSSGEIREFSLSELDSFEQSAFETTTIWTDEVNTFSGVSLASILKDMNAVGATLRMTALNDYSVDMPIAEVGEDYPIIATRMDGEVMSVREKGPYWVVFPYDSDPAFQTETTYARSIWQLNRLTVLD